MNVRDVSSYGFYPQKVTARFDIPKNRMGIVRQCRTDPAGQHRPTAEQQHPTAERRSSKKVTTQHQNSASG